MPDAASLRLFEVFVDHSLPKPQWTHHAHLTACWVARSTRTPEQTLAFLRGAIRSYNEVTGVANTPTSGYHETITRSFVGAVDQLAATAIDDVLAAAVCDNRAPLRHWRRETLFTPLARATWVPPDLAALPWVADHAW